MTFTFKFYIYNFSAYIKFKLILGRCDGEEDRHAAYVSREGEEFPPIDQPTAELFGEDNMINFSGIDIAIVSGESYKWRVDCVEGINSKRRTGDEWSFMLHD